MTKPIPRVVFVRHGQTEWSKSGQHTSVTDLHLTEYGVEQIQKTSKFLVGDSPFSTVHPINLKKVIVSPRTRTKQTADILLEDVPKDERNWEYIIDEDAREWEYGDYEGLKTAQVEEIRRKKGLMKEGEKWSIWRDGCENGENAEKVTKRVDRLIEKIQKVHAEAFEKHESCDILLVAHGHILRCFAARWILKEICVNPRLILDAGGVGLLTYEHNNIKEPAMCISGAFQVPSVKE